MDENDAQGCADHDIVNKGGRPTLYKPEYCDRLLFLAEQGKHIYEWAHALGVTTKTLYNWERDHPQFLHAFTRAKEAGIAWLEKEGRENLSNRDFKDRLFEFMYRSKTEGLQATTVHLPKLGEAKSFSERCTVIIEAVAVGEITVMQAQSLINVVSSAAKVDEITQLKAEVEAMENIQGSRE